MTIHVSLGCSTCFLLVSIPHFVLFQNIVPKYVSFIIISLPLDHRRKALIGGADPPVVPITNEISPDEGF